MAKLRIEFERIGGGRGLLGGQLAVSEGDLVGSATLTVTGIATPTGSQPVVPASPTPVYGRLIALDLACYVDAGPAPDPVGGDPILVMPGQPVTIRLTPGDRLAAILAADVPPSVQQVGIANGLTITQTTAAVTATSAVKLAANANRRFLAIANIGVGRASLNFGAAAVADGGWPLAAASVAGGQGGSLTMEGAGVSTQAIHAASAAGTTLVILEG